MSVTLAPPSFISFMSGLKLPVLASFDISCIVGVCLRRAKLEEVLRISVIFCRNFSKMSVSSVNRISTKKTYFAVAKLDTKSVTKGIYKSATQISTLIL